MFYTPPTVARYSNRRPLDQAWEVHSDRFSTYAPTEERVYELHCLKGEVIAKIDYLLNECAVCSRRQAETNSDSKPKIVNDGARPA